jgi:protein-tyrosine phosphatase
MPPQNTWPRWSQPDEDFNLREVAPNLWVGAEMSPLLRPAGDWRLVVDFYGSSQDSENKPFYQGIGNLLHRSFHDGIAFPPGVLDDVLSGVVQNIQQGPVLLHCQAGLSRSASAAYAMMRMAGQSHQSALARVKVEPGFPRSQTLASAQRWVADRKR